MRILLMLLLIPIISSGQIAPEKEKTEKSKIETFSLKTGSLFKKEFIEAGDVKKVAVRVIKISDMILKSTLTGIQLKTEVTKSYGGKDVSCFLDSDEVDGLIKAGKVLIESIGEPSENYTEFTFTSRDGFEAGAYLSKKDWKYYLKLEKYDSDSYVFLEKKDFETLVNLLTTAKTKL